MASELILHHYDFSNFSEKIRLVLGLKELSWRSVEIAARGHGRFEPMTAEEAIQVAANADPIAPLPSEKLDGDPSMGEAVEITPTDYGRANPSVGTLVSIDALRMSLEHANERTGRMNVHFPRFGYRVRAVSG